MTIPLSRIDLNLFRVLLAIHEHGGISRAAQQLHLSQPAVSHALSRLRAVCGDALFVRQGNRMLPTEMTQRIVADVRDHLHGLQGLLQADAPTDFSHLNMTVKLGMRDVLEAIALPPLVAGLAGIAPLVRLHCTNVPRQALTAWLTQGEVDMVIDRQRRVSADIRGRVLGSDGLAVVRAQHPAKAGQPIDVETYMAARHVLVAQHGDSTDPLHSVCLAAGLPARDIGLICQHYYAAAKVVAHTGMLLTLPATFALQLAETLPLEVCAMPLPVPNVAIWLYWHQGRDADPVHRWLREQVAQGAHKVIHKTNNFE